MANGLSVSDIVNVSVSLSPQAAATQNFGSLLLVGSSPVITTSERIREYSSLEAVGADFGMNAEYQAADLFFSQQPQPSTLYIGRWAQSATSGELVGATQGHNTARTYTEVTAGSMAITVDSVPKTLTALDFSGVSSMQDVATVLTTALGSAVATYNSTYNRFEITSNTSGPTSSVSFASATGSGTDVSTLLGLTQVAGAVSVAGIAQESLLQAVQVLAAKSNDWYGLAIAATGFQDSDVLDLAGYVEGSSPQRFFVATTQDPATLDPDSTTDLASQLKAGNYSRTALQYSSSSANAAVSLFARQATTDFTAQNSTITLAFKSEPGVAAENLTETQASTLRAKNCNVFVNYSNDIAIIQFGTTVNGGYIDSTVGLAWLQNNLQMAVFNLLYQSTTKIPQTDAGVGVIATIVEAAMDQAVTNGLLAPGTWTGSPVGAITTGQMLTKGYYVYAAPVATQKAADRSARKSPPIQVLAKLGGAIHEVDVVVSVAQ